MSQQRRRKNSLVGTVLSWTHNTWEGGGAEFNLYVLWLYNMVRAATQSKEGVLAICHLAMPVYWNAEVDDKLLRILVQDTYMT